MALSRQHHVGDDARSEVSERELIISVVQDGSQSESVQILTREISFDPGYELAFFTLRNIYDGHLQSYMPLNATELQVRSIPIAAQLSGIEALEKPTEDHRDDQRGTASGSLSPHPSSDNPPYHGHTPNGQTYNIPLRGGRDTVAQPDDRSRELSVATLERHANARDDGYTNVCGVRSPATSTPVKKYNPGKGEFRCPRCGSNFTRPKSVKDHFPYCISKCGNPQALRFTDHPSMAQTEAAIQRRTRASREPSAVANEDSDDEEDGDARMDGHSPEIEFKEMSEALARTSLRLMGEDDKAHDDTKIKTEFVFGADIPRESIETPSPEPQSQPGSSHTSHDSLRIASSNGQRFVAQTPDWNLPLETDSRHDSSTPTPHSNPWDIGIPGSAAEHAIMDMRATAPFEGWSHASQTPEPTSRDGTQNDGLDDFMDRRSHFSPTPAASRHSEKMGILYEDCEMEE